MKIETILMGYSCKNLIFLSSFKWSRMRKIWNGILQRLIISVDFFNVMEPKAMTIKLVKIVKEVKIDRLLSRWNSCHSLDAYIFLHVLNAECMVSVKTACLPFH